MAELWALKDGLRLCLKLNLAIVKIEVDVKVVFHHATLIMSCENLLNQNPRDGPR